DAAAGRPFKDVMAFVREEVFEGLSDAERHTLSAVSVHRANVPREAALAAASSAGAGPEVLDRLVDRGLVADVGEAELHLHDLVREFFFSRLTEEERTERHAEAAEAWGRIGTPDALVERAHHLVGAGEAEAAVATLASDPSRALGEIPLLRDVLSILDEASATGGLTPAAVDEADLLRGDALAQMDQVDSAMAIYTRVMDRAVAEGDRGQEARVLYRIGRIHGRRGQDTDSMDVQRRAIAAFEEVDDEAGAAMCRLAIAEVLVDREETDSAVEELGHAHESFTLVEDRLGVARSCVQLASIMLDREDPQLARSYLKEAHENLDRPEDVSLLSWVHYYMGEADRMEDQWEEATVHYERAVDLFQQTGEEHMAANACTYLGDAYQAIGDTERAEVYYQRGLDMMVAQ
ncbi:MAG: tetratricopeptide repeat protein, partial [Thermoplasmata archaeon]